MVHSTCAGFQDSGAFHPICPYSVISKEKYRGKSNVITIKEPYHISTDKPETHLELSVLQSLLSNYIINTTIYVLR